MGEKDWELLVILYEEENITRAAQRLYLSQPALTYRIKQIENHFKVKLLYRGNKGITFTNEGELLVKYAKNMLHQLEKTRDDLKNISNEVEGILRIGGSSNFALYQLPSLLEGFIEKYPKVEIRLNTGWSSEILSLLQNEIIHLAILRGDHNWDGESIVLMEENLCIVSKEKIKVEDLPQLNLINYKTDFHLKNTLDDWWFNTFKMPPKISMEVDRIETCKELVKRGLGYALIPEISLKEEDNLYKIKLTKNNKELKRKTFLLFRKELQELNIVNALVKYIKEFYKVETIEST